MANFTFPQLTTAVVGYASTIRYQKESDVPDDSGFTVTIGTRRKGQINAVNYNHLTGKTASFQRGKRPGTGVLYPRGGG